MEVLDGRTVITPNESELLSKTLNIEESLYDGNNIDLIETLIRNLPMQGGKKDSVIKYIKDNLE